MPGVEENPGSGADFKATLFVRATARPTLEPDPKALAGFHAIAREGAAPMPRSAPAGLREIASILIAARPSMLPLSELAHRCEHAEEFAAECVLRLVAERRADLYLDPPPYSDLPGERPEAPALARVQACSGSQATSLLHEQVILEQPGERELLCMMDGTRNRSALASELSRIRGLTPERATRAVDQHLERLTAHGLLLHST